MDKYRNVGNSKIPQDDLLDISESEHTNADGEVSGVARRAISQETEIPPHLNDVKSPKRLFSAVKDPSEQAPYLALGSRREELLQNAKRVKLSSGGAEEQRIEEGVNNNSQVLPDDKPGEKQVAEHGIEHGTERISRTGIKYIGQLKNGLPDGFGRYINPGDGTSYIGEFKAGKREGFGKLTKSDGEYYTGEWVNDKPTGAVTVKSADGQVESGIMREWQWQGIGVSRLPSGEKVYKFCLAGDRERETPDPIPNSEVKPLFADGTLCKSRGE